MTELEKRVAGQATATLKNIAVLLQIDLTSEAGDIMAVVLQELMRRLPTAQYVKFCDRLGGE